MRGRLPPPADSVRRHPLAKDHHHYARFSCADRSVWHRRHARRGRDGCGLPRRAIRAGPAAGRAQDPQVQRGLQAGACPLRDRASGAGDHGPSVHREGVRRRSHRGRALVFRHGAGHRGLVGRFLRRGPPHRARACPTVRRRVPRGTARASEGRHPPGPEAVERPRLRGRREAASPHHRLRDREGDPA